MKNGNGSNGNGHRYVGTFAGCARTHCLVNAGQLRPGEARMGDGNPHHVVDCTDAEIAADYNARYPRGMSVQQWLDAHARQRGRAAALQPQPPVATTV